MTSTTSTTAATHGLAKLSEFTTISIDSGDLDVVKKFAATGLVTDATTNPLFVSQAGANGDERYAAMVDDAVAYAKKQVSESTESSPLADFETEINLAIDKLSVNLGAELTKLVEGRVSTEVDIRLSYDTEATVMRARRIISMYEAMGIDRGRILIKLTGTWEGIQAAKILEAENIQCNITLIFSFLQACAAAQAKAHLISPFVGRILDWHRAKGANKDVQGSFHPAADPGVLVIKRIFSYFKHYKYKTIVMPCSWRPSRGKHIEGSDIDELCALAGVDEMTISPSFLEAMTKVDGSVVKRELCPEISASVCCDPNVTLDEATFRAYWEAERCGKEKLEEGIKSFTNFTLELKDVLYKKFAE
mmetsp:Transcript_15237/g.31498  ORF Transcript_15237/g.31498 Transcript_15237/m.31498 type:complete len:362 (+) Transcript_15237:167-1252(+)|eukprot:CAMPEP_0168172814 /NCGR_PEP_ID=MMETSP0139_2-20121125/5492_1 /TAXON_ID=44445 /ORGANISM="Pseudo-nitzschia australis, Strain 10249 10 AB" /LENGTH=361 /DNA_ID=CAMNT_0008090565 /DNA_START=137 /DNA_END=1222 /DNA_ORIENTATION=+